MDDEKKNSKGALVIWGSLDPKSITVSEEDLNLWWTFEHLPERIAIPGFMRCRRYHDMNHQIGDYNYLVWYETSTLNTLKSQQYLEALNNPTEGTRRCLPILATLNRSACRVLHSRYREELQNSGKSRMVGGTVLHIVLSETRKDTSQGNFLHLLADELNAEILENPVCVSLHLLEHDESATQAGSTSKSYADTALQQNSATDANARRWMILIDLAEVASAKTNSPIIMMERISGLLQRRGLAVHQSKAYRMMCVLS